MSLVDENFDEVLSSPTIREISIEGENKLSLVSNILNYNSMLNISCSSMESGRGKEGSSRYFIRFRSFGKNEVD
jgi:hypothetical protein